MKCLANSPSSKSLDEATKQLFGIGTAVLIEKASLRLWDALRASGMLGDKGKATRIVALCGRGGNGQDALAILRHAFSSGYSALEALVVGGAEESEQGRTLAQTGLRIRRWSEVDEEERRKTFAGADLLLDGVLGTGATGPARGEAVSVIQALRDFAAAGPRPKILSVDLPSGLYDAWREGEPIVWADLTLSLEPRKAALYLPGARKACGEILPVEDVFPERLLRRLDGMSLLEEDDLSGLLVPVDKTAYKMRRGRVAVFAGSMGGTGAARLCAKAATAAGAGYVTLYADEEILPALAEGLESVIVKPLRDASLGELKADLVLVGPGWGRSEERGRLLADLAGLGLPLVLDADALRLLAQTPTAAEAAPGKVLTPHPGEFAALAEGEGLRDLAFSPTTLKELGSAYGAVLLHKSHVTWIRGMDDELAVWDGMSPELGTAGSGDVLAGLVAGIAASALAVGSGSLRADRSDGLGRLLFRAAEAAVIAHGLAGRRLASAKGWFEAADLIPVCSSLLHGAGLESASRVDDGGFSL